jgi:tryptophan-rich sensory protein
MASVRTWLVLIICVGTCFLAAFIGSRFTASSVGTWYAQLVKPAYTPPNWVFGPVWSVLYLLMGVAAFLVWQSGPRESAVRIALAVFLVQLVVNVLWSAVFFGARTPLGGLAVIVMLWLAIVLTMVMFARASTAAALLLVPYLAWVSYASYLNLELYRLNTV